MKTILNKFFYWMFLRTIDRSENAIKNAVFQAFQQVGLPAADFRDDYDLLKAGKLMAVLHIAGKKLGIDPELNTVGDVIKWLKE